MTGVTTVSVSSKAQGAPLGPFLPVLSNPFPAICKQQQAFSRFLCSVGSGALAFSIDHNCFQINPSCYMHQWLIHLYCWVLFRCMERLRLLSVHSAASGYLAASSFGLLPIKLLCNDEPLPRQEADQTPKPAARR